jgi:hypothetical protein
MNTIRLSNRATMVAGILLVALGCAAVWQWGVGSGEAASASGGAATAGKVAHPAQVSSAQKAAFGVLRATKARAAETLPSDVEHALDVTAAHLPIVPSQVRALVTADGTKLWLVPGDGELCVAAEDSAGLGLVCAKEKQALTDGVALVQRSRTGGDDELYGVLPDGYSAIAATHDAAAADKTAVVSNGYHLAGRGLDGLRLSRAAGGTVTSAIGG